jgi:ParB family chromosome partitioning protein
MMQPAVHQVADAAVIVEIRALDTLRPNRLNPRGPVGEEDAGIQELAASIRESGLLQPLGILPDGTLTAGHRRLVACRLAGLHEVPVIIRTMSEAEQLTAMLAENIQREALNPVQTARGCQALREHGKTLEQVAVGTGLSSETVRKHLQLLTLPEDLQRRCAAGELPLGYVPHLVRLPAADQVRVALDAITHRWYMEELARVVDKIVGPPPRKYPTAHVEPPPPRATASVIALFTDLTTAFRRDRTLAADPAVQAWITRLRDAIAEASQ